MSQARTNHAFLIAAAASWGLGTVLSKYALGGYDATVLLPFQLLVSVLLLLGFVSVSKTSLRGMHQPARIAWLGVLNPGVAYALGLLGLARIDASVSVIIWATEPVLIVLMAFIFLRETIAGYAVVCLAGAMLGVTLIVGGPASATSLAGVLLTFAAVFACALYSILLRRMHLADGTLSVVFVQQVAALTFAVAVAAVDGVIRLPWHTPTAGQTLSAILGGGLYYGVAFLFYVAGLRRTSAAHAGMFLTLVPVFGLIFSGLLLGEKLGARQALGAVLVIGAMGALGVFEGRRIPDAAPRSSDRIGHEP